MSYHVFSFYRMTLLGSEIIATWSDGALRSLIENSDWEGFAPAQKQRWLREMNCTQNMFSRVRLQRETQMAELFFQRRLGGTVGPVYVAGKWVRLTDFPMILREAVAHM